MAPAPCLSWETRSHHGRRRTIANTAFTPFPRTIQTRSSSARDKRSSVQPPVRALSTALAGCRDCYKCQLKFRCFVPINTGGGIVARIFMAPCWSESIPRPRFRHPRDRGHRHAVREGASRLARQPRQQLTDRPRLATRGRRAAVPWPNFTTSQVRRSAQNIGERIPKQIVIKMSYRGGNDVSHVNSRRVRGRCFVGLRRRRHRYDSLGTQTTACRRVERAALGRSGARDKSAQK
jgi:hypothetical protein